MTKAICCIVESSGRYGLLATQNERKVWQIQGFESVEKGLWHWEEGYRRAHQRSYESSMSACISFIFVHPSIVEVTLKEIKAFIIGKHVERWSTMGNYLNVILLKPEAQVLWAAGKKPALIKEEWNQPGFFYKKALGG